jgi:hypothetical protein
MKSVQILGTAPNLKQTPPLLDSEERWACNSPLTYVRRWARGTGDRNPMHSYTRWFNLHSREHMLRKYPDWYKWYGEQPPPKRILLQQKQRDIHVSEAFPREAVLTYAEHRYFSFSGAWQMAYAAMEGFDRVVLAGFQLNVDNGYKYNFERPCFFYWVNRLRSEGIDVVLPVDLVVSEAGDPFSYDGPLYGYQTTEPHFDLTAP